MRVITTYVSVVVGERKREVPPCCCPSSFLLRAEGRCVSHATARDVWLCDERSVPSCTWRRDSLSRMLSSFQTSVVQCELLYDICFWLLGNGPSGRGNFVIKGCNRQIISSQVRLDTYGALVLISDAFFGTSPLNLEPVQAAVITVAFGASHGSRRMG